MRNQRHAWLLILGVLCSGVGADAQKGLTAPDIAAFVGDWTLDLTKSGATDLERRIISHGPGWMRVEIHRPGDVRPPGPDIQTGRFAEREHIRVGTATTEIRRDRNDIVTVTVFTISDRPVTVQERLQITAAGDMTAAVLVRVEHGYQGVLPALEKQAPNVAETSNYFRKTP